MFFNARTRRSRILIAVAAARTIILAVAVTLAMTVTTYDHTSPRAARARPRDRWPGTSTAARRSAWPCAFRRRPQPDDPKLLDILKQDDLHATFFVQGQGHIAKYPAILRRISDEGHEIGNHTWYHEVLTDINENDARQELARTQDAIEKITGTRPILMRPPEGRTNRKVAKICRDLGLAQVLWSVTAKDYETTDSALITKRVLDQTHRDGIILLHDLHQDVPAVPGIIKALKQRGYTIVTVSQLLAPPSPSPGWCTGPEPLQRRALMHQRSEQGCHPANASARFDAAPPKRSGSMKSSKVTSALVRPSRRVESGAELSARASATG